MPDSNPFDVMLPKAERRHYYPINDDAAKARRDEASRLIKIIEEYCSGIERDKEWDLFEKLKNVDVPVSPEQLFYLRDIKDKYL